MRSFLQIVIVSAALAALFNLTAGCVGSDRSVGRYLDRAEELMEPSPDSAYSILTDSITPAMLSGASDRQRALHALLLTQSEYKLRVAEPSITDLTSSINYFDRKDDQSHLMKALYYQARLKRLGGDNATAMTQLMRARSIAKGLKDDYWQARADDVISLILEDSYYYDESISYSKEAAELYNCGGHEDFHYYSLGDQARCYLGLRDFDKCKAVIDSLIPILNNYPSLKLHINGITHLMYEFKENYSIAEQYGDTLLKYIDINKHPCSTLSDIAYVKIKLGKLADAKVLLDLAAQDINSTKDSIFYYDAAVEFYREKNDLNNAFELLQQKLEVNNNVFRKIMRESAVFAQRNFYSEEALRAEKIAERNKLMFIFSAVIAILLILLGSFVYKNRLNKKNADISKKITEILLLSRQLRNRDDENKTLTQKLVKHGKDLENLSALLSERETQIELLSADLSQKQSKTEYLNAKIESLLQGRFTQLNSLINEYAEQDENDTNYLAFYKNMKHEIEKFRNPKGLKEIEKIVDDSLNGVITKIREHIPNMKEKEIIFIVLSLAGLNARAIGLFLGLHPNYTYRRKKQLIKIIQASSVPDKDRIVDLLSKC